MPKAPLQREVWGASLDPVRGHEQGEFRPVLILSSNDFNALAFDLVMVAPITTKSHGFPTEVDIPSGESGLAERSYVLAHQVRTISQDRLVIRNGQIGRATFDRVIATIDELFR